MWDGTEGKFWSGTGNDGETINTNLYQVPLKVQAWAVLSLDDEGVSYWKALTYVEKNMAVYNEDKSEILGFDFNNDLDGVWFEGTVQMTAAYYHTAQKGKADNYMSILNTIQLTTGAMEATSKESITTGFQLANGSEWLYYRRPHVGVTAWLLLAEDRTNPFWL